MPFNKQQYDQNYAKKNFDRIPLNVKKGEKEKIQDHAKKNGFSSITEYIKALIYNDMETNNKPDYKELRTQMTASQKHTFKPHIDNK